MRRFGLDYPALREVKPDLIYCAISGYGQTGPSAGAAGLCAGDPRRLGLRPGASRLSGGRAPAGLLRHLYRRRADRHLCLRRDHGGALPAAGDRRGPDDRRVDAGKHAEPDLERDPGGAVSRWRRRAGRSSGRSPPRTAISTCRSPASGRSRTSPPPAAAPDWITDPRFAEYPDRRRQLGRADRRARGLVDDADQRRGAGGLRPARRAGLALSHGQGGDGRPAARAPRRLAEVHDARRQLSGAEPAVPASRRAQAAAQPSSPRSASTPRRCWPSSATPGEIAALAEAGITVSPPENRLNRLPDLRIVGPAGRSNAGSGLIGSPMMR